MAKCKRYKCVIGVSNYDGGYTLYNNTKAERKEMENSYCPTEFNFCPNCGKKL